MRNRKLKTIARRWWNAEGGDYDWERVDHIVRERHDLVPRLIKALYETSPPGWEPYIGCVVVEDLEISSPSSKVDDLPLSGSCSRRGCERSRS
ncbi:hypothetical protein ASE14_01505 [Agromyces sp. Root81]|nr:hypothetical protein ASE14_01505 [Agromyces sp. Root81]